MNLQFAFEDIAKSARFRCRGHLRTGLTNRLLFHDRVGQLVTEAVDFDEPAEVLRLRRCEQRQELIFRHPLVEAGNGAAGAAGDRRRPGAICGLTHRTWRGVAL
ncbi:MAG: hypothetical protein H7274_18115 [Rhodoferax sp.]|nr:hypothetical protein [Rhodoferax sp.]